MRLHGKPHARRSLLDLAAEYAIHLESSLKCHGCNDLFSPNSARQTHYCSPECGNKARNERKRMRRLALRRNIEILDALRIPVGYSQDVDLDELYAQGFDPNVHTDRLDFLLPDGITQTCRIYMERYLIQNDSNTMTIQHL